MKKSIFAFLALIYCLFSFNTSHAFSNNLSGFYLGPDVGYAVADVKVKYINASTAQNLRHDASIFGPYAGLHAGYQKDTGAMLIGSEIYVSFGSITGTLNDMGDLVKIKTTRNFGFGGAFKLGAKINKIVFYTKIAGDYSKFQAKIQDGSLLKGKNNKFLFGVGPGLGVEGLVSKSLILGAEWTLLKYQSKNFFNQLSGQPVTAKFKPMVSEFKIRLSVKI